MKSPFRGLKDKIVEVKINKDIIKVLPRVEDAETFMLLKKETTKEDLERSRKILVDMIMRANPEEDVEDVKAYLARNYNEVLMRVSVVFGFMTDQQVDDLKKKQINKLKDASIETDLPKQEQS